MASCPGSGPSPAPLARRSCCWPPPRSVAAHGPVPADPPTLAKLALGWRFDPIVAGGCCWPRLAWVLLVAAGRPAASRPPGPGAADGAFLGGLAAIAVALLSGIERYDTTLFSIHMVQHLLLLLVAAPLLALSAPVTQLLRAASPRWRRRIVGVLHSGPVGALGHPVVAWVTFTLVLWVSHFSPLFDVALENQLVHDVEHVAFLAAGLLFWWPVVAADPGPAPADLPGPGLYLLLQMPPSSFLGMLITFATRAALPALRDARGAVRHRPAGRPAARRRDHVARRRRGVHRRDPRRGRRMDAPRGARHGRRRAPGRRPASGDSGASGPAGRRRSGAGADLEPGDSGESSSSR